MTAVLVGGVLLSIAEPATGKPPELLLEEAVFLQETSHELDQAIALFEEILRKSRRRGPLF